MVISTIYQVEGFNNLLLVLSPPGYNQERNYIYDVLLGEFLGLDFRVEIHQREEVRIKIQDETNKREIIMPDVLFQTSVDQWLTAASLPVTPLKNWNISESPIDPKGVKGSLPIIYGKELTNLDFCNISDNSINLALDIFGSSFFMLTRYEELVKPERDVHGRFMAKDALAFKEDFLFRPIVNEYLEILWWAMKKLWPDLKRKQREFQVFLTHDVDRPISALGKSYIQILKTAAGDLIKRKNPKLAIKRLVSFIKVKQGDFDADLANTFDFIMDYSEKYGLKSAFYFITGRSAGAIDAAYSMDHPWIRNLLRKIHQRGHEIGLHPSYNTFQDYDLMRQEFETLIRVCQEEGIYQSFWGGRQHYLRWENPLTWQSWQEAGLAYESSVTFAETIGFRTGVCYQYPAFNLLSRKSLRIIERPLTAMEATLLQYMNLSPEKVLEKIMELKDIVQLYEGDFTLLWHNSSMISQREKDLYGHVIDILMA